MHPEAPSDTEPAAGMLDTRDRLIEAGIEIFADRGFADASVRSICARADANAAAVNYHFRNKANLYAEVLATCHLRAVRRRPMPRLDATGEPPQKVLRRWIRWFLELLLVDGSGPLGRLMAREMADPTPTRALETLAERSMLPMLNGLRETLMALLPGGLGPVQVQLFLHSVVGQCLFYRHAQPALERLHRLHRDGSLLGDPRAAALGVAPYDLDRLADHIATFSLAGLATADPAGAEP